MNDKSGELISPVILNGRIDQGMPKFNLSAAQISDVAAFIHSFKVGGYDESRMTPLTILTGDARAGESAFRSKCAVCHSTTGDLKGIAARISDTKQLQQTWLIPGSSRGPILNVPPVTVSVTLPTGQKAEGRLARIDDFIVTLTDSEGTQRTFTRNGDNPKVEVHDPLQPHKELLRTYSDAEIHNLTAYLVTVK